MLNTSDMCHTNLRNPAGFQCGQNLLALSKDQKREDPVPPYELGTDIHEELQSIRLQRQDIRSNELCRLCHSTSAS